MPHFSLALVDAQQCLPCRWEPEHGGHAGLCRGAERSPQAHPHRRSAVGKEDADLLCCFPEPGARGTWDQDTAQPC